MTTEASRTSTMTVNHTDHWSGFKRFKSFEPSAGRLMRTPDGSSQYGKLKSTTVSLSAVMVSAAAAMSAS